MKYMRKPIPIEAVETGRYGFLEEPDWLQEALSNFSVVPIDYFGTNFGFSGFKVLSSNGKWLQGNVGDYVVRAADGTLYACERMKFERDFDKLEDKDEEIVNDFATY